MSQSIFSRIISGEEPGEIVYEDSLHAILLSRAPQRPGHSLVVPKREVTRFYEMDSEAYISMMQLVRAYAQRLNEIYKPKVVALEVMGLGVDHVHVHVVPIEDEHDLDQDRAKFVGLEIIRPEGKKIRSYLAQHPLRELQ